MISYKEFIIESSTTPQLHDVNAIHRSFPELLSKKRKPKLSWKQRRQHRRQSEKAGATSIGRNTGEVVVSEARNFTITNQFGGIKYKNIKKATPEGSIRVTNPKVDIEHNYLSRTPMYYSNIAMNRMRRQNAFAKKVTKKIWKKSTDFLIKKPIIKTLTVLRNLENRKNQTPTVSPADFFNNTTGGTSNTSNTSGGTWNTSGGAENTSNTSGGTENTSGRTGNPKPPKPPKPPKNPKNPNTSRNTGENVYNWTP